MREQALREAQVDKFDATVRMLTESPIELRAAKTKIEKKPRDPEQGLRTLDSSVVQLGRRETRQKGEERERERKGDHTRKVE
jgi:hypothetical protein